MRMKRLYKAYKFDLWCSSCRPLYICSALILVVMDEDAASPQPPRLALRAAGTLCGHERSVAAAKFSPDGRYLATGCTLLAAARGLSVLITGGCSGGHDSASLGGRVWGVPGGAAWPHQGDLGHCLVTRLAVHCLGSGRHAHPPLGSLYCTAAVGSVAVLRLTTRDHLEPGARPDSEGALKLCVLPGIWAHGRPAGLGLL